MPFKVVEFKDISVECVPVSWLDETKHQEICYWPRDAVTKKRLGKEEMPDKEKWAKYTVKILVNGKVYADFARGSMCASRAEDTSNLDSDITDMHASRPRRKPQRYQDLADPHDEDSDTDDNECDDKTDGGDVRGADPVEIQHEVIELPRAPEITQFNGKDRHQTLSVMPGSPVTDAPYADRENCSSGTPRRDSHADRENCSSVTPLRDSRQADRENCSSVTPLRDSRQADRENCSSVTLMDSRQADLEHRSSGTPLMDSRHVDGEHRSSSTPRRDSRHADREHRSSDTPVTTACHFNQDDSSRRPISLDAFKTEVLVRLDTIEASLQTIKDALVQQPTNVGDDEANIETLLPGGRKLDSETEVKDFDDQMENMIFRKQVVKSLSKLQGSKDIGKVCRTIMRAVMTNNAMSQFSIMGQKGKSSFKETTLFHVILKAVIKAIGSTKDSDVATEMGDMLRNAPNQPGGTNYKKKRTMAAERRDAATPGPAKRRQQNI